MKECRDVPRMRQQLRALGGRLSIYVVVVRSEGNACRAKRVGMVAKVRLFECRVKLGRGSGSYKDDGVRGRIGKAGFRGRRGCLGSCRDRQLLAQQAVARIGRRRRWADWEASVASVG